MNWRSHVDRFWAGELGLSAGALRRDGFHVCERADPERQPRAIVVGTSSATILSLPRGCAGAFEAAGLNLGEMKSAPRRYLSGLSSNSSLEVRGPAYLAYWPPSSQVPPPQGLIRELSADDGASLTALRDLAPEEWSEAGIGADSRVFGALVAGRIVAVAGYECWPAQLAHLQVFCLPDYRRRGLATNALRGAMRHALAAGLLPQYRARDANMASRALATRLGFVEYGWMATVLVCLPNHTVQRPGAFGAPPGADLGRYAD